MPSAAAFSTAISSAWDRTLNSSQQQAVNLIHSAFQQYGDGDTYKLAYIYATAWWESSLSPIPEHRASPGDENFERQEKYWHTGYYGRGYVQLTHDYNYRYMGERLGIDLLTNKEDALIPENASRIIVIGMTDGKFTGEKLGTYIHDNEQDFYYSRLTVNGLDKAATIANFTTRIISNLPVADCMPKAGPVAVKSLRLASDHVVVETFPEVAGKYVLQVSDDMVHWEAMSEVDHLQDKWLTSASHALDPSQQQKGFVRLVPDE